MSIDLITDHARFMSACGQEVSQKDVEQVELYTQLCEEEFNELFNAISAKDTVETADAIIDSIVVLIGLGVSLGFPMHALWDEVLRSNMSKLQPDGTVMRRSDGKILKPDTFSPPDIANILQQFNYKE